MILFWVCLSIRRNGNTPRRHAAERLFEAFKEEIQDLSLGTKDAYQILKQAFPKHERAYTQFRPYVKGKVANSMKLGENIPMGGEKISPHLWNNISPGGIRPWLRKNESWLCRRF